MSYESKLVQSIQSDYRRDAAIEREYGVSKSRGSKMFLIAVTIMGLATFVEWTMSSIVG